MKKAQLSIYLDPEIFANLEAYATRQGKPKSLVAEAAIASFLSPDDSDRREAAIAKRLDRIVRVLERLERNDGVTLETMGLFIRFWLTSTPALQSNQALQRGRRAPSAMTDSSKRLGGACPADRRFSKKLASNCPKLVMLGKTKVGLAPCKDDVVSL